jgi:hypothetical protein
MAAAAAERCGAALVVIAAYPFAPGWFTAPVTASYAPAVLAPTFSAAASGQLESPPLASDLARFRGATSSWSS